MRTRQLVERLLFHLRRAICEKKLPEFDMGNHVRYTAERVENLINSLFQIGKFEGLNAQILLA